LDIPLGSEVDDMHVYSNVSEAEEDMIGTLEPGSACGVLYYDNGEEVIAYIIADIVESRKPINRGNSIGWMSDQRGE
jgi:hypothetical protein